MVFLGNISLDEVSKRGLWHSRNTFVQRFLYLYVVDLPGVALEMPLSEEESPKEGPLVIKGRSFL